MSSQGKSLNTERAYISDLEQFFADMKLDFIDLATVSAVAANWLNTHRMNLSPKTVGRRITSLRALGRVYGVQMLVNYKAPTPAPLIPHPLPGLRKDLQAMIDAAQNDQQRTLVALLGLCGCRVAEALSLHPEKDVYLHDMVLSVRGKGDKTRIVPISKQAWAAMGQYVLLRRLEGNKLIVSWSNRYARALVTEIGRRAGISRPVSSHDLRATFATCAYQESGNDIRAVQQLLGHSSVIQTTYYVGVSPQALRAATGFMDQEAFEDDDQ